MLSVERRHEISEWIYRNGKADISELARMFNVSCETIRRDLNLIADEKNIRKVHGGVVAVRQTYRDEEYSTRKVQNAYLKQKIGNYATRFLSDNDTVAIDSGTTTENFAKAIFHVRNLKIITYSIPVATILVRKIACGDFTGDVILLSGTVNPKTHTVYGSMTLAQLQSFRLDKAFISCTAVSEDGISAWDENDGLLTSALMQNSKSVYLLADSEKFCKQSFYHISGFQDISTIITDNENPIDEPIKKVIDAFDTELFLANAQSV